jgi:predicted small secreted protein
MMMARSFLVVSGLLAMLLGAQGCETVKGTSEGIKKDVSNTAYNVAGKDGAIMQADRWFKENAW